MTASRLVQGVRSIVRSAGGRVALALLLVAVFALAAWRLSPRDTTLERVRESGVWRVALDPSFPPFEDLDPASGQPVGFDVDLAQAIAARMGVKAQIVPAGFDELVDAVAAHKVDGAVSALPEMPWRSREVGFSAAYVEAGTVLVARPGTPITGTAGLAGHRVAVEWGSEGDAEARQLQKTVAPGMALVQREDAGQALAAVAGGDADAAIVDAISLALHNRSNAHLVAIGPPLQSNPYVIVVPQDAPGLLNAINDALGRLQDDGTLARLRSRWLGD